jgi:hypothetical protein
MPILVEQDPDEGAPTNFTWRGFGGALASHGGRRLRTPGRAQYSGLTRCRPRGAMVSLLRVVLHLLACAKPWS